LACCCLSHFHGGSIKKWIYNPSALTEDEVNLDITWTADAKTTAALERQACCNGFESVKDYLQQMIAAQLASDEDDTVLSSDGRFVSGYYAYDEDGNPRNV
jgi:hypothetical protein